MSEKPMILAHSFDAEIRYQMWCCDWRALLGGCRQSCW